MTEDAQPPAPTTREEWLEQVVLSLIDVVEELCMGLAYGQTPEKEWAYLVAQTFGQHKGQRAEL